MNSLAVWMYGEQIGMLSRERGKLVFQYKPKVLQKDIGLPLLSVSMPTRQRAYQGKVPQTFFDGLLPEGEARRMIAYDFGLTEQDVFGLLKALGRDCAGALVIIPEGEMPKEMGSPEPITDTQIAERICKLRVAPLGIDQRIRVSLAGMQEKLLLSKVAGDWCLPIDGFPSTHILKPAHPLLPNSITNEAFCMRLAHRLGVLVAPIEVNIFDGIPVLVIERYDRSSVDQGKKIFRLHQEDFCQAHSLEGRQKYEEAGGPSLLQCAGMLERWAQDGQLERLLDITVLNVIVGNADAHAKNLSLLHQTKGQIQLAPAYDIMTTLYYAGVSTISGMFMNGNRDISETTRNDLLQEAISWGMSQKSATDRIEQLFANVNDEIHHTAEEIQPPEALVDMLLARAKTLTS